MNLLVVFVLALLILLIVVTTSFRVGQLDAASMQIIESEQKNEERLQSLISITFDYTFFSRLSADGKLKNIEITGTFEAATGYTTEEFLEVGGWRGILHPDFIAQDELDMAQLHKKQSVLSEVQIITKSSELRWVSVHTAPIWDSDENRLAGIIAGVQDITERKQMEHSLRENEEQHRLLSELMSDYAWSIKYVEGEGFVPDWIAGSFASITGYTEEELRASNRDHTDTYHADDYDRATADVIATREGQNTEGEYRLLNKDGDIRWVYIKRIAVWDEENQRVSRYYGIAQDITDRKRAEQQRIEIALEREKADFYREFIRSMTHDFKTPLSIINTSSYLLSKSSNPDAQEKQLSKIKEQVDRLTGMIDDILTVARLDYVPELSFIKSNINTFLLEIEQQLRIRAQERHITIHLDLETDLPVIMIAEDEVLRALLNLCENALNYTPEYGHVYLRSGVENGWVICEVQDTGIGIAEADVARIFEQFYRANNAREFASGTGLGLAIVKRIMELHRGDIDLSSTIGEGTSFKLRFPSIQ